MTAKNNLTLTEINKIFYEKDGQLYWKKNVGKRGKKDSIVGHINCKNYIQLMYKRKIYMCHRILYQIYNNLEEIPEGLFVDHIDRNKINNSKENLRLATRSENNCNTKIRKDNILGIKNIHIKNNIGYSYYYVALTKNNKTYYKYYPKNEKGLQDAIIWRDQMLQKLHGEFSSKG